MAKTFLSSTVQRLGRTRVIAYLLPIDASVSLFVAGVKFTPDQLLLRLEHLFLFSVFGVFLPLRPREAQRIIKGPNFTSQNSGDQHYERN